MPPLAHPSFNHPTPSQIPRARPYEYKRMKKSERTVSRTYGGVLCAGCCKDRVLRAFLLEEQKEVKRKFKNVA